jgi:hypothetical protein
MVCTPGSWGQRLLFFSGILIRAAARLGICPLGRRLEFRKIGLIRTIRAKPSLHRLPTFRVRRRAMTRRGPGMDKQRKIAVHRRGFLNGLIGGLSGGSLIAAAGPLVASARAGTKSKDDKLKSRYRVSDEVKTYYRVNRYPA